MRNKVERIAVLTSGGDSPGMNAAIRGVVRTAIGKGIRIYGIRKGYAGIFEEEIREMYAEDVSHTINLGGTILYTARCKKMMQDDGPPEAAEILKKYKIDGLVVIGGDGSYRGAQCLSKCGINVIGIPGTIDLDIGCTDYTIGFDTAVNTAVDAIDKIKDSSTSHERCSIVEVMGRSAGYIALVSGIATGAEEILMPENYDYNEERLINNLIVNRKRGHTHHIIINAEGIGDSMGLAERIEAATGIETRASILGYLQRGGSPTSRDRMYASVMGTRAVELLASGARNRVLCISGGGLVDRDIDEALKMEKHIPEFLTRTADVLTYHYTKKNSI